MSTESAVKANPKARSLIEKLRVDFDIINITVDNKGDYQREDVVTERPLPCMIGWYAGFGTQYPIGEGRIYLKIATDEGNECLVNEQDIKHVDVYKRQERVEF